MARIASTDVLAHFRQMITTGEPIAQPDAAQKILSRCPDCHDCYAIASMEPLPFEGLLREQTRAFKTIKR